MERRSRVLPREIYSLAHKAGGFERSRDGEQKSAEAVVAACARRRRAEREEPNRHEVFDVRTRRRHEG